MKVLVATRRSQGERELDFDDCIDGELVWVGDPCGRTPTAEGAFCTCALTFVGASSFGMTTTAAVADLDAMTPNRYAGALRDALRRIGRNGEDARERAEGLASIADVLPVGTVVERFRAVLQPRHADDGTLNPTIIGLPAEGS